MLFILILIPHFTSRSENDGPIIRVFDRCGIDALVYARRYVRDEDAAALQASTKFQSCIDLYRQRS